MAKENVDGQQELVEKYLSESGGNIFCRDASNPSEPAGLNTSDSELEKRVRPRGENPKTFETRNPQ